MRQWDIEFCPIHASAPEQQNRIQKLEGQLVALSKKATDLCAEVALLKAENSRLKKELAEGEWWKK